MLQKTTGCMARTHGLKMRESGTQGQATRVDGEASLRDKPHDRAQGPNAWSGPKTNHPGSWPAKSWLLAGQ